MAPDTHIHPYSAIPHLSLLTEPLSYLIFCNAK